MALSLFINGHDRAFASLDEGSSLETVVRALELKADRIAVERNGSIAARNAWAETLVYSGDRLEVVHFVGGGTAWRCARPR